jgi:hypothetical protein
MIRQDLVTTNLVAGTQDLTAGTPNRRLFGGACV